MTDRPQVYVIASEEAGRVVEQIEAMGLDAAIHVVAPGGPLPFEHADIIVIASPPYPPVEVLRRLATPVIRVSESPMGPGDPGPLVDVDSPDDLPAAIEVALQAWTLREQTRRGFRELVETLPAAAYTAAFDASSDLIYISPRIQDILGFWPRELLGDPSFWTSRLHPDDRDRVLKAEAESRQRGEPLDIEYRMIRRDGSVVWLHDQAQVFRDEEGHAAYFHGFLFDVTARKRAEVELTETEDRVRRMLESVKAIVWRADADTFRFTYVSPEAEEILGYPTHRWMEPDFWVDHIHPDDRGWVYDLCARATRANEPHELEYRMVAADGRDVWLRDVVNVTVGDEGRELVGVMVDVTAGHLAEEERNVRARQHETLAELGRLALTETEIPRLLDETVRRLAATLEVRYAEVVRKPDEGGGMTVVASVGWSDDQGETRLPAGLQSLAGYTMVAGEPVVVPDTAREPRFDADSLRREHGVESAMSAVIAGSTGDWGALVVHSTTKRDFTTDDVNFLRSTANIVSAALIRDEGQRRISLQGRLLQEVGTPVVVADTDGTVRYWNEAAVETTGFSVEEAMGRKVVDLLVPDQDATRATATLKRLLNEGRVASEWRLRMKDGSTSLYHVTTSLLELDGRVTGVIGVAVDITERKRMERRLRASETRFRTAFDASATGMVLMDPGGRWLEVNQAMCDMLRYERDELIGTTFPQVTHPEDIELSRAQIQQALDGNGEPYSFTKRYLTSDGDVVFAELHAALVRDPGGAPLYFVTQVIDITDRVRGEEQRELLEHQLMQAQKMEAVGRLAGGIAHDFNNLLSVILNYASFVDEEMAEEDARKADVAEIRRASERASVLVRQLLTFSRKEVVAPQVVDVNDVIRDMSGLLERTLTEDITLHLRLSEIPSRALVDIGQLEQILMNLVVNSRDALPRGGKVAISTEVAGGKVHLSVADNGEGMSADVIEHAFEPFFTTKPRGRGTGLGLSTVYGIATGWNGRVWIESERGVGTTIHLEVPEEEGRATAQRPAMPRRSPAAAGNKSVLVVEDEDAVRLMIVRILTRAGYEVLAEASGEAALELLRQRDFDVLLTDVVMPGMSGRDLVEALDAEGRKPSTIYMSGYTHEIIAERGILAEGEVLLQKPFGADALLERIEAVVTGS